MKFSIIHPSYKRPLLAFECFVQWRKKAKYYSDIDWIISLSNDDPNIDQYIELFDDIDNVSIIVSSTTNVVQAANATSPHIFGDIIILVSDDMLPCDNWDIELISIFYDKETPLIVQVNDSIREDILTLPIMNKQAYALLGYLYHPKYISMWADNDLTEVAKKHNLYYDATHLKFEHNHYSVGKSKMDETYQKENSSIAYQIGKRIFEDRKKLEYPII